MFLNIKKAKYLDDYKIEVLFNNGESGVADLLPALKGNLFSPLKDKSLFSKLRVDEELSTIVWEDGLDLAPEYIYFQAFKDKENLQKQFKEWGYIK